MPDFLKRARRVEDFIDSAGYSQPDRPANPIPSSKRLPGTCAYCGAPLRALDRCINCGAPTHKEKEDVGHHAPVGGGEKTEER